MYVGVKEMFKKNFPADMEVPVAGMGLEFGEGEGQNFSRFSSVIEFSIKFSVKGGGGDFAWGQVQRGKLRRGKTSSHLQL